MSDKDAKTTATPSQQSPPYRTDQTLQQKKAFEQGNANNSTTDDPKIRKEDPAFPTANDRDTSNPQGQSKEKNQESDNDNAPLTDTGTEGESIEDDEDTDNEKQP